MKENRLVVGDRSWAEDIPEWLLNEIRAERMILGLGSIIKPDCEKVGDAEVIVYLMTASLRSPISSEYTEIYVYLTAKMMKKRGKQLEDFMEKKLKNGLTDYEERELKELREMIYRKRGGEINHPVLNLMRNWKKDIEKEDLRLKNMGQKRLI